MSPASPIAALPLLLSACEADNPGVPPAPVEEVGDDVAYDLFDDTMIHTVAITLDVAARSSLVRSPYEYVPGDVVVDGTPYPQVGVRLRGKIGSFRDLAGKPKFKLDFNRYVAGRRLGPYETIALNNEVVDCSYLREMTGFYVFRQLGLVAPRTAFTQVTVNDEPYGVYVALEYPDDQFLERHYADASGNLYDGKYAYNDAGEYERIDFTPDRVGAFQLEEGTDVGHADVTAISDAIRAEGTFADRLGPYLDLDAYHRFVAAEQWIGELDGYALNANNYRVYFDPEDGRAELLVYDLDYSFYSARAWGMDWSTPFGALTVACQADADCLLAQHDAVTEVVADVDTDAILAKVDAWTALVTDAAKDDPRRECRRVQIDNAQEDVRAWAESGSIDLAEAWAGIGD